MIGATSQQYPAADGIARHRGHQAAWAEGRHQARPTPGKDFFDTGVALVTDKPVDGVDSIDSAKEGMDLCWG